MDVGDGDSSNEIRYRSKSAVGANASPVRKSALSLRWEDFFGSTSDLTSSIEKGLQTLTSTDIDIDHQLAQAAARPTSPLASPQHTFLPTRPFSQPYHTSSLRPQTPSNPLSPACLHASGCSTLGQPFETKRLTSASTSSGCSSASFDSSCASLRHPLSVDRVTSSTNTVEETEEETEEEESESWSDSGCATMTTTIEPQCHGPSYATANGSAGSEEAPVKQDHATQVVMELLNTEEGYFKSLEEVTEGYLERLTGTCDEETISVIFANLPKLCTFHRNFLNSLKKCEHDLVHLSGLFMENSRTFQDLYSDYCTNYTSAIQKLEEIRRSQPSSWEVFLSCQSALGHQLPLATYLLKPVQRILKYQLLLQELCKALLKADKGPLAATVRLALDSMARVADGINERKRRHEHLQHVSEIRDILRATSAFVGVDSLGDLVLDGEFRLPGKKEPRFVLLFQRAILVSKRSGDSHGYIMVKQVIRCTNLMLIETIPKDPLAFHVLPFDNPKCQQTLQANSAETKRSWCQEIKRLIVENYDAAIPEHAKQIVLNMNPLQPLSLPSVPPSLTTASLDRTDNEAGNGLAPIPKPPRRYIPVQWVTQDESSTNPDHHSLSSSPLCPVTHSLHASPDHKDSVLSDMWGVLASLDTCHTDLRPSFNFGASCTTSQTGTVNQNTHSIEDNFQNIETMLLDDDDFRCIAVEINEERCSVDPAPPTTPSATAGGGKSSRGHSRNGSISALLAGLGGSDSTTSSSGGPTMRNGSGRAGAALQGGAAGTSLYINCPGESNYDQVTFGKVYNDYIERTRTDTVELTTSDIDEILRPLRLEVSENAAEVPSPQPPATPIANGNVTNIGGEDSCSSGGSSPRNIVSRIAVNHNPSTSLPAVQKPSTRQINSVGPATGRALRGSSTVSRPDPPKRPSILPSADSHPFSPDPRQDTISRPPGNNTSQTSNSPAIPNLVQWFFRAHNRNKRDKKADDSLAEDPADEPVSVLSQTSSKEDLKSGTLELHKRVPNSSYTPIKSHKSQQAPAPPISSSSQIKSQSHSLTSLNRQTSSCTNTPDSSGNHQTLSRKKGRAPAPPPVNTTPSSLGNNNNSDNEGSSDTKNSEINELELCRGRFRTARSHLIDSLPFADDGPSQEPAVCNPPLVSNGNSNWQSKTSVNNSSVTSRWSGGGNAAPRKPCAPNPPVSTTNTTSSSSLGTSFPRRRAASPGILISTASNSSLSNDNSSYSEAGHPSKPPRRGSALPLTTPAASTNRVIRSNSLATNGRTAPVGFRRRELDEDSSISESTNSLKEDTEVLPVRGLVKSMMNRFNQDT